MYTSPFDAHRFPDAPVMPDPDGISTEAAAVLHRLRSTLPDPVNWNAADPVEMATALARAIFDHEAARLTLDLPDDRMDLPVALHQDDPRLLQLLDTARHIRSNDPDQWPTIMDTALEAVQAETAQVMQLDGDGLQARDLDNQNLPLYETIHEDMLDRRLETRYQGILNPGTLRQPPGAIWMPPLPGTYRGVLPVRPSPMPEDFPSPAVGSLAGGSPAGAQPPAGVQPSAGPQPQPTERSATMMPDYQIREVFDPGTLQTLYCTELHQVSRNLRGGSRIWGMHAENDTLPLDTFDSREAAQAQVDGLRSMEPLREALRNLEPVTVAGVPYDPVRNDDGSISSYRVRDGLDQTDMPLISPWELQQYAHTGKLTPELAVQQLQNAERSGHAFTPFEEVALQAFARDANADPRFTAYREQEEAYITGRGGVRSAARHFSLDDLPRVVQDHVQTHRFDLHDRAQRFGNEGQEQEIPASARTTETGLHLGDLHLPDVHRDPMRVDAAFREAQFIRAFHTTPDALAFVGWVNGWKAQRAALERDEPLTLGNLRYVPAGVPGEYRATDAETGQPIDRQIIDRQTLHDLLYDGVVQEDLAQQWELHPSQLDHVMQALLQHRQNGLYDFTRVAEQISRYAPGGIIDPSRIRPAHPVASTEPTVGTGPAVVLTAAEQQAALAAQTSMNPQSMEYQDESTSSSVAAMKQENWQVRQAAPVVQEKTQKVQQEGQEVQQEGQKAQQKGQEVHQDSQKSQQEDDAENDGKNRKGQGQKGDQQEEKAGGFSLFSRVHQHHHYQEPSAKGAPAENIPAEGSPAGNQPGGPQVSKRDTMGVMDMMNQAQVTAEEINAMNHRVQTEGLTPEVQKGIKNISERGQRDVKDGKLTPDQLQKNANALNQLGDTVNRQPDSEQKKAILEHIRELGKMLVEAVKRIFHLGRATSGPSM